MPDQPKKTLITGITGQDGSCLAELLPLKGHVKVSFEMPEFTADSVGWGPCGCSRRRG